jgi:hypothetical protein
MRIMDVAREFAGAGHPEHPNVITGNLRASINWRHLGQGKAEVGVIENHPYAIYVEFGTGIYAEKGGRATPWRYQDSEGNWWYTEGSHPYPYFRPALTQVIDGGEAMEIIKAVFQNAVNTGDGGEGELGGVIAEAPVEDIAAVAAL